MVFTAPPPSLDREWVALDLEATGPDPVRDEVIEVAAVRFRGEEVLATFSSLVNPYRPLPAPVQRLTGISPQEVERAPPFAVVAGDLASFVGESPLVGHSVHNDLAFLARRGLSLPGPAVDTRELAGLLLSRADYSLAGLAAAFGIDHPRPHRALPDALATHRVFLALVGRLRDLDPALVQEVERLAGIGGLACRPLLRALLEEHLRRGALGRGPLGGIDLEALGERLRVRRSPLRPRPAPLDEGEAVAVIRPGGPLQEVLPPYRYRREQEEMLRAVFRSLAGGHHMVVEAGTGVGKTVAYLVPALLLALRTGSRVVVSTHTIALQEQVVGKDIPLVVEALARVEPQARSLRYALLKGRGNYLCLRRWAYARSREALSPEEAGLLARLLLWLPTTTAGDRAELALSPREGALWERWSAQGARECPPRTGPCFLRSARERAEEAHLLVVNHALLLSDLVAEAPVLPPYDYLIVDEAQHLEEEATRQFGRSLSLRALEEHLDALVGPRGLASEAVDAYRTSTASPTRRERTQRTAEALGEKVAIARGRARDFFSALAGFLVRSAERGEGPLQVLVTPAVRARPGFSALRRLADDLDMALGEVGRALGDLTASLEGLEGAGLLNYEGLLLEIGAQEERNGEVRDRLRSFFAPSGQETIYWVEEDGYGDWSLHTAPLSVAPLLRERLFQRKKSVVLTSATLSVEGSFHHLRERVGLEEAEELLLGSPFDYRRAVLLCLPTDVPEPETAGYGEAVVQGVLALARALGGHTMVLFTSHRSLRALAGSLRPPLEAEGVRLLAQGVDGSPRHLLEEFARDPRAVLLGTATFWEGVDIVGEALKALVVARLPFNQPTEPVFAARSQLYQDPFRQFAIPLALLRFRQGFGRLIRGEGDRGAVVVLDRRVLTRPYGPLFLRALPLCTVRRLPLREVAGEVARWLGG